MVWRSGDLVAAVWCALDGLYNWVTGNYYYGYGGDGATNNLEDMFLYILVKKILSGSGGEINILTVLEYGLAKREAICLRLMEVDI